MSECRQIKQKTKKTGTDNRMIEYLEILRHEIYKIVFLLVPILVSVAMIVWLDRRVWGLVQKEGAQMLLAHLGFFKLLPMH